MDMLSMMAAASLIYMVIFANNIESDDVTDYCVDCGDISEPGKDQCYDCIMQDNAW